MRIHSHLVAIGLVVSFAAACGSSDGVPATPVTPATNAQTSDNTGTRTATTQTSTGTQTGSATRTQTASATASATLSDATSDATGVATGSTTSLPDTKTALASGTTATATASTATATAKTATASETKTAITVTATATATTSPPPGSCGAGDTNMPAEPAIPPACTKLEATQTVAEGGVPIETGLSTATIQAALNDCAKGQAVRLVTAGGKNAFITGPFSIPDGVSLWVDKGVTLYATRDTSVWGSASSLISVKGAGSGIVGEGVIDGQGGEPNVGSNQSWWDQNADSGGNSPALITVSGASNFTLYRITLHNSPKFHVKLGAAGFVVWGVTVKAPSKAKNSAGTTLTHTNAHNTDGIDPGQAASDGYIVCSAISVGDDQIAIKGSSPTGVKNLTIAHNHFGAGHGMSIGSEFTGGVSDLKVYDLSIDNLNMGTSGGSSNGIRIKSDSSRGGLVNNASYSDICMRNVANPILLTPFYSTKTGNYIPQVTNVTIRNLHSIQGGSNAPHVTLDAYDAGHANSVTLDNVIIEGLTTSASKASYTQVTKGPGDVSFTPSGTGVTVINKTGAASTPRSCTDWGTF